MSACYKYVTLLIVFSSICNNVLKRIVFHKTHRMDAAVRTLPDVGSIRVSQVIASANFVLVYAVHYCSSLFCTIPNHLLSSSRVFASCLLHTVYNVLLNYDFNKFPILHRVT